MTVINGLRAVALWVSLLALVLVMPVSGLADSLVTPAAAQDASVPARPTGLATVPTHYSVTLSWDDPNDPSITHYEILRRDRAIHEVGEFVTINPDTGSPETTYADATVKAEQSYVYRVKAVNAHGVSESSGFSRADPPAAPAVELTPEPNAQEFDGVTTKSADRDQVQVRSVPADATCPGGGYNPAPTPVEVSAVPIVVGVHHRAILRAVREARRGGRGGGVAGVGQAWRSGHDHARGERGAAARGALPGGAVPRRRSGRRGRRLHRRHQRTRRPSEIQSAQFCGRTPAPRRRRWHSRRRRVLKPSPPTECMSSSFCSVWTSANPGIYFMNTETHEHHGRFLDAIGVERTNEMVTGVLQYEPDIDAADGSRGVYTFWLSHGP